MTHPTLNEFTVTCDDLEQVVVMCTFCSGQNIVSDRYTAANVAQVLQTCLDHRCLPSASPLP